MQKGKSMKILMIGILSLVLCAAWSPKTVRAEGTAPTAPDGVWTDSAATEFAGGTGTKADPYQIATAEQLAKLAADVNSGVYGKTHSGEYFVLMADLDLSAHRWIPVGNGTNASSFHTFDGFFNGANHTISGLYVDESNEQYSAGLFGHVTLTNAVEEVTLQNLKVVNAYVKTEAVDPDGVGILAGHLSNVKVRNCEVSGTVEGSENAGGMIGIASYANVKECMADVQVTGKGRTGGMTGNDYQGYYAKCQAKGKVNGGWCTGGFVGVLFVSSEVEYCKSEAEVRAYDWNCGGFAGYLEEDVQIKNCVATGDVISTVTNVLPKVSGFAGTVLTSSITDSHATGKVTGGITDCPAGGFVGSNERATVSGCSFDAEINTGLSGVGIEQAPGQIEIQAGSTKEVLANICEDYEGGHAVGEVLVVEPTCTEDGKKYQSCTRCGTELNVELIPASGHQWNSEYTVDKEATCTEDGSESIHCSKCDATKDSRKIPAKGHSYGEWVVVKEPTATAKGLKEKVCEVCRDKITEELPMLESEKKTEDSKKQDTSSKNQEKAQGKTSGKKTAKTVVKTGDDSSMAGWSLLILASAGVFLAMQFKRKRR